MNDECFDGFNHLRAAKGTIHAVKTENKQIATGLMEIERFFLICEFNNIKLSEEDIINLKKHSSFDHKTGFVKYSEAI
jgi:hypothetical protein